MPSVETSQEAAAKDRAKRSQPIFAGFSSDGRHIASLKEVRDPTIPTRTLADLTYEELVRLTVKRLSSDKGFLRLRMLGVPGLITRTRAIKEIKAGTIVGAHLLEIEKRYIQLQIEEK